MKPCTLDVHLLNSWGYFTSGVSIDKRTYVCMCVMWTHDFACHDCVCKYRRHKGVEIRLIAFAISRIPPSAGVWGQATSGGLWLGSWLYGCLNKSLTHSLGQVAGDETTRLLPLALFPCTHPNVRRYKLRSVRHSAHVHLSCNSNKSWGIF